MTIAGDERVPLNDQFPFAPAPPPRPPAQLSVKKQLWGFQSLVLAQELGFTASQSMASLPLFFQGFPAW